MRYRFENLSIPGLVLVTYPAFSDDRGKFAEFYRQTEFASFGFPPFVQDNFSVSAKGVLRGLHYQLPPKAQGKLVTVLEGEIFDVVVDIRKDSQSFKKWQGVNLKAESGQAVFVPPGFAHGFMVISEVARVLYKTTAEYDPELERGIVWNDRELNINWPMGNPIIKPRDAAFPPLASAELF